MDGKQYGETRVIEKLAPDQSLFVFEDWRATAGNHTIYVEVDYENSIDEYNETNNVATITILVDEQPFPWDYVIALIITLCIAVFGVRRIFKGDKKI